MKVLLLIPFLLSWLPLFSQQPAYTADTLVLKSAILNEDRTVIVYKPIGISAGDSISFLYLIDGEYSFYRYGRLSEEIPDLVTDIIAVGIINTDRRRDLLYIHGGDHFLDFITNELIPLVEKGYCSNNRILYGHSFGGGYTVYTLLNRPNSFNCYIASSPTPIMQLIKGEDYLKTDSQLKTKTNFYVSYGSRDMGQVRKWAQRLKDNLNNLSFNNLEWHYTVFEGSDHNTSAAESLITGLKLYQTTTAAEHE